MERADPLAKATVTPSVNTFDVFIAAGCSGAGEKTCKVSKRKPGVSLIHSIICQKTGDSVFMHDKRFKKQGLFLV